MENETRNQVARLTKVGRTCPCHADSGPPVLVGSLEANGNAPAKTNTSLTKGFIPKEC